MSILELLQHIVNEDAPRLTPEEKFPREATLFVNSCLFKDPDARPAPKDLLVRRSVYSSQSRCIKSPLLRNTSGLLNRELRK